jgi:hypothetical protein
MRAKKQPEREIIVQPVRINGFGENKAEIAAASKKLTTC